MILMDCKLVSNIRLLKAKFVTNYKMRMVIIILFCDKPLLQAIFINPNYRQF